jgi:hypothetical protein
MRVLERVVQQHPDFALHLVKRPQFALRLSDILKGQQYTMVDAFSEHQPLAIQGFSLLFKLIQSPSFPEGETRLFRECIGDIARMMICPKPISSQVAEVLTFMLDERARFAQATSDDQTQFENLVDGLTPVLSQPFAEPVLDALATFFERDTFPPPSRYIRPACARKQSFMQGLSKVVAADDIPSAAMRVYRLLQDTQAEAAAGATQG